MDGRGVHLALYKYGQGIARKKRNVDKTLKMSKGVTTDVQLQIVCAFRILEVPYLLLHYRSKEYVKRHTIYDTRTVS